MDQSEARQNTEIGNNNNYDMYRAQGLDLSIYITLCLDVTSDSARCSSLITLRVPVVSCR